MTISYTPRIVDFGGNEDSGHITITVDVVSGVHAKSGLKVTVNCLDENGEQKTAGKVKEELDNQILNLARKFKSSRDLVAQVEQFIDIEQILE